MFLISGVLTVKEKPNAYLILTVDLGEDTDPGELDFQTRRLRKELLDLPLESADLLTSGEPPPEGAKSVEGVTLGALGLAILPEFIPKLVEYLQSWVSRDDQRKIKVKAKNGDRSIELEYSPDDLSRTDLNLLVTTLMDTLALDPQ